MSLATVHTRAKLGILAPSVSVEVHLSNGLPAFHIVGLPEAAVKESKDRVRSAIINAHFDFPARRITVNLAPAELPKEGSRFDLAIAIGTGNASEAALVESLTVLPAKNLLEVSAHLHQRQTLTAQRPQAQDRQQQSPQLNEVIGQQQAKRALEIAAAGRHHLLFYGPPGTGKTMLASRLPGLLPPLSNREALQVASLYSVAGKGMRNTLWERPFRNSHHTASAVAMVGGGSSPRPGEISLAHCGILFLDELAEFKRSVLEVLREPLESGEIMISRVAAQTSYPAKFQLIAAMNPCPCGYLGSQRCICTPEQITRYRGKVSGPLLDRIDLQVQVSGIENQQLLEQRQQPQGESNAMIQQRVSAAQQRQQQRQGKANAELSSQELKALCPLDPQQQTLMDQAINRFALSTRGFYRVLKVARTIADLAGAEIPNSAMYQEALSYRAAINSAVKQHCWAVSPHSDSKTPLPDDVRCAHKHCSGDCWFQNASHGQFLQ